VSTDQSTESAKLGNTSGSETTLEYRQRAATWLSANVPPDWRAAFDGATPAELLDFQRRWLATLHTAGYAVPHWPVEYGGSGASIAEQIVLRQEMMRADAPELPMFFVALNHASAALIKHGSSAQRALLAGMLDGDVWCQGFSEPNAGSDLASLATRAERHGDQYVVNGQKVWSSYAQQSRWCLLLARTDPTAAQRSGISLFILDLALPGVEVRPIRTITGELEFCEVFLTDVPVPAADLVGHEGEGWTAAQTMLSTERGSALLQFAEGVGTLLEKLIGQVVNAGDVADTVSRQLIGDAYTRVEILRLLSERTSDSVVAGTDTPIDASILKVYFSELLQWLTDAGLQHEGLAAFRRQPARPNDFESTGLWFLDHLMSWRWTIAAGSNQIQRTLIGERGLGLPR
jgi:alkylation response protein AidB-like acyl-CoA dehydrogenase